MSVFDDNITSEISLKEKVRVYIDETLDSIVDLVNNHFGDTKLNIVECGDHAILLPPNTATSFIRETNDALKKLCRSEFGHQCGLLITKPISLEYLESTQSNIPDPWTKYRVRVIVDCFIDGSTIPISGFAAMYTDVEMVYEKILYNEPHWP